MTHIELVPYDSDFLDAIYSWRKDPVSVEFNPIQNLSVSTLHEICAKAHSDFCHFDTAEMLFWLVRYKGTLVGDINVRNINRQMLTAEIGYNTAPDARGNGYATAAVSVVSFKAFTEGPLRKLIAFVSEENIASRRVLEKCGYTAEGLLREHYLINNRPVNEVVYGLLRKEVKALSVT